MSEKVSERKSDDTVFTERKLKVSAATDPKDRGSGDEGPELTPEDDEILDRIWNEIDD
ncbi:MAG: hypothetical protein KBD94_10225 [Pyrinomonadaceae bacterium]|nr:hypothetical protein [Pyrinomonadaceae bacterium]